VLDALSLSRARPGKCRFCDVLVTVLDAFFEKWRGARVRVNVELKEKTPVKVGLDGEQWKNETVEIYAGSGRSSCAAPFFIFLSTENLRL
jgi:hypothetical protein